MPSSVAVIFSAAGLTTAGAVRWGDAIPVSAPGVYAVALTADPGTADACQACLVSRDAVAALLSARGELRLDGARPDVGALSDRLAGMWLGDEVVLYIGLAGTSLRRRVRDYYRTPLGARRPHAGGWPLKTLTVLADPWVHFAACDHPAQAEEAMLRTFAKHTSEAAVNGLHDPSMPIPFANLELTRGERKRHGITGAREPAPRAAAERPGDASWPENRS